MLNGDLSVARLKRLPLIAGVFRLYLSGYHCWGIDTFLYAFATDSANSSNCLYRSG